MWWSKVDPEKVLEKVEEGMLRFSRLSPSFWTCGGGTMMVGGFGAMTGALAWLTIVEGFLSCSKVPVRSGGVPGMLQGEGERRKAIEERIVSVRTCL